MYKKVEIQDNWRASIYYCGKDWPRACACYTFYDKKKLGDVLLCTSFRWLVRTIRVPIVTRDCNKVASYIDTLKKKKRPGYILAWGYDVFQRLS